MNEEARRVEKNSNHRRRAVTPQSLLSVSSSSGSPAGTSKLWSAATDVLHPLYRRFRVHAVGTLAVDLRPEGAATAGSRRRRIVK